MRSFKIEIKKSFLVIVAVEVFPYLTQYTLATCIFLHKTWREATLRWL